MSNPADVLVIGAGAIGASVAYELSLRGARVQVIEQGSRPAAGCSRANAGLLVPSHSEPLTGAGNIRTGLREILRQDSAFHLKPSLAILPWLLRFVAASSPTRVDKATRLLRDMGIASLQRHSEYVEMGVATSFTRRGMIDIFASEQHRLDALASIERNSIGLDYDVLTPEDVRTVVPGTHAGGGGIHFRNEAHCDGRTFVEATLSAAERLGARVSLATRVTAITRKHGRVAGVETTRGFFSAATVVVAGGHLSAHLTRPLGLRLPLAPAKGYVIDLEPGPEDPAIPVGLKEAMVVLTPYPDRLRVSGSLELVGPGTTIHRKRTQSMLQAATRTVPHLRDRAVLSLWTGMRPCSADGLPLIGTTQAADGLVLATGHGQQGLVLAPATGRAVADAICASTAESEASVAAFSPDRFRRRASVSVTYAR